mmetsp:Transcript_60635/g.149101  ORF Transcript_60635/g.149101 Transcript_60635/m.149101 type:complete len:250 (-) Transcript_60635:948-1697(-)
MGECTPLGRQLVRYVDPQEVIECGAVFAENRVRLSRGDSEDGAVLVGHNVCAAVGAQKKRVLPTDQRVVLDRNRSVCRQLLHTHAPLGNQKQPGGPFVCLSAQGLSRPNPQRRTCLLEPVQDRGLDGVIINDASLRRGYLLEIDLHFELLPVLFVRAAVLVWAVHLALLIHQGALALKTRVRTHKQYRSIRHFLIILHILDLSDKELNLKVLIYDDPLLRQIDLHVLLPPRLVGLDEACPVLRTEDLSP